MEWSSLIGAALLLTLCIVVLRVLWCWVVVLLVLGPPAYAGIVVGHLVSAETHNTGVGIVTAVVVAGVLPLAFRKALRRIR